jgi:DNA-binding beta-propeller fold protein YncE
MDLMRLVARTFDSWSRGWGRIGVTVATFALGTAVSLSFAPPALASWTQVSGSPFATGKSPSGVAFSPSGGLLAVTNDKSNTVSVYAVGSGGALQQVSGSPFATGIEPDAVAFSPNGALLAVANFDDGPEDTPDDGTASVFAVGAGGVLRQVSGSPFSTGRFTLPSGVAFSPSGRLLAVTNSDLGYNSVSVFAVGAGGQLTPVSGSPFGTGFEPLGVAFSPSGGLLADADGGYGDGGSDENGSVTVFAVGSGGQLTHSGSPLPGDTPEGVAFSPSGRLLAYTNPGSNGAGDTVSVYAVGSGDALTQVSGSPFATGTDPAELAFSPTGGLLADANRKSNTVSVFAVGSGGLLTPISGSPFATGDAPVGVAFSPGGGLLATANNGGNSVSVYAVGPPSVTTFTTPPNGATYTLGQVVDASYSCADDPEGPGIASCNAPVANESPIDTSTAGPHSFTVTATSKDGQSAVVTNSYAVNDVLFGSPVAIPTGLSSPVALTLGDFDVTGREVVRTAREDIAAISSNAVSWIHAEGGGAFASPVVTKLPDSPKLSDIATLPNPDGSEYVAIADEAHDLIDVGFLSATGFNLVQQVPVGCAPSQIATGDFTGEAGGGDFAVACADAHVIAIVLATPPPRLGRNPTWAVSQTFTIPIVLDAGIATVLDNAAGGVDIVATGVSSFSDEGVTEEEEKLETLLPTSPPGTYVPSPDGPFLLRGVALTFPVATATATLDGRPSVIVASLGGAEFPPLVDYLGNGDGTYAPGIPLPTSSASENPTALATGSFNSDSVPDLAVGEQLSNGSCLITIDLGDGTGGFTAGPTPATCGDVNDMQVGDLNGESLDDIAYTDPGDNGLFVLYQDPPVIVAPTPFHVVASLPAAGAVGLLIQRRGKPHRVAVEVKTPTGTKRVTREVPTLITVGHIPLGPHHKGRNTIRYKLLVNGHPLAPGSYIVTLRSLNAKGRVLDLSQPVALTVDRHGHAHFGQHVLV